ncbi:unnamed protein product [Lymnaea stagnalis]|uniref:N-acetyltransferase domain-containing protein n=1 Tax=Lymnaea stagnalis TaxID=6523 RepID=A0AAV2IC57_LYMST
MEVLPLHKHKEYLETCIEILNEFWPRSKSAREHSLNQSCDALPISLAFVRKHNHEVEVIGYSRIAAVQGIANACLVESVIVRESHRGKGLGRILMQLTENYAKVRYGVKTVYLNTLDQAGFYSKVGYIKCKPVISLGANANRLSEEMVQKLLGYSTISPDNQNIPVCSGEGANKIPEQSVKTDISSNFSDTVIIKTQAPPPPPPPPPPPSKLELSLNNRAVVRMNPDSVTWMKKDL